MAVYRVNKNRGYTVMANFHLRDKSLSLKAVGLLSKMLSFNDGWKFSTKGLSAICKEGPDAILAALRELETHGYLVRHRKRDGKGRMGCFPRSTLTAGEMAAGSVPMQAMKSCFT